VHKSYVYKTSCVSAKGEDIQAMQAAAVGMSYRTMLRRCEGLIEKAEELNYVRASHIDHGLTLRNDWHVSYHKSMYRGEPCYYFVWSHIEYIWVKRRQR